MEPVVSRQHTSAPISILTSFYTQVPHRGPYYADYWGRMELRDSGTGRVLEVSGALLPDGAYGGAFAWRPKSILAWNNTPLKIVSYLYNGVELEEEWHLYLDSTARVEEGTDET